MKQYQSPYNTGTWSKERLVAQMCHTIGHEFFIHAYRHVIPAMKAWNADDLEAYNQIVQIDSGESGDYDHASYIQRDSDYGLQKMYSFQQSLQKRIGKSLFKKVKATHDVKFRHLQHTKIPPSNANDTQY